LEIKGEYEEKSSVLEVVEYSPMKTVIGRATFDIAEFGPMLDKEPYLSDPTYKLQKTLQLPLTECKYDGHASLEVLITLDSAVNKTASSVRSTMMQGMHGKLLQTSQVVKQDQKQLLAEQIATLTTQIAEETGHFQSSVAPLNAQLQSFDAQRLSLESDIVQLQTQIKELATQVGSSASMVSSLPKSMSVDLLAAEKEKETLKAKAKALR
jgi:hypothetical protein